MEIGDFLINCRFFKLCDFLQATCIRKEHKLTKNHILSDLIATENESRVFELTFPFTLSNNLLIHSSQIWSISLYFDVDAGMQLRVSKTSAASCDVVERRD